MTERRADDATRDVMRWLKAEYMVDRVGEVFSGAISGVTSFGLFVQLDEIFIDGLIHITALGNDYFHFDAGKSRLTGERTRKSYRPGDRLQVVVVRVDVDEGKIDLELADEEGGVKTWPAKDSDSRRGKQDRKKSTKKSVGKRGKTSTGKAAAKRDSSNKQAKKSRNRKKGRRS